MKTTESSSRYDQLEKMSVKDLLVSINQEDKTVPEAVEKAIPQIEVLVNIIVEKISKGGRLFYIGAGTSGRLAVVDASECPPTFGVPEDLVVALIAGGDEALRRAVEFAEDDEDQAWKDLQPFHIRTGDVLIGVTASGSTPYVVGGLRKARSEKILTACITCNTETPAAKLSDFPVEVITGPEFITGSTRLKAGTAQKLVLNMISTSVMVQIGRVKGNKMVEMMLSNKKLIKRGIEILISELGIPAEQAKQLLQDHKNVRKAIEWHRKHA